ncbi:MAG: iron-sulfur cluster repair di-iron protein [Ruminiclostridium sp.]|nr:iron-sulfur cluster repair di-iron protein [Ruminiclostridium sp.]
MDTFKNTQNLGEIVSIMLEAGNIFKQYKIDFCCRGNRSLAEAAKEQNLSEPEILKKLNDALGESKKNKINAGDFRDMSPNTLIKYILNTHHTYTKRVLPELGELTTKIMSVHGVNHDELFRVHKLFSTLKMDLEQHLQKEEGALFPMMEAYEKAPADGLLLRIKSAVKVMENEHEGAGTILKELRNITGDYKVPDDGCGSYRLTYTKMQELEADLFQHIHLENNILFKKLGIDIQ